MKSMKSLSLSVVVPIVVAILGFLGLPTAESSAQILEQTKTVSVDLDLLLNHAREYPDLLPLILRNRDKALWLIEDPDGIGQTYSIALIDPPTVRFNPRRCMRVVTDTLLAIKLGGMNLGGDVLTTGQFDLLKQRATNEMRAAADQALGPQSPNWYWWDPLVAAAPEQGTLEATEATACLAVGYDWLRGSPLLNSIDRSRIRQALLKGLRRIEDFAALRFQPSQCEVSCKAAQTCSNSCWSNWNAVLNGTAIVTAVALENEVQGTDATLVQSVLDRAPITLQTYMRLFSYEPTDPSRDGSYPEGPTYLNYSLEYFALADAALAKRANTAAGFDFQGTGLQGAGKFAMYMLSPNSLMLKGAAGLAQGVAFNFADSSIGVLPSISMLSWLGRYHNQPKYSAAAQLLGKAALSKTVLRHTGSYTMDAYSVLWFTDTTEEWAPPETESVLFGELTGRGSLAILKRKVNNSLSLAGMLKGGMAAETPHGHMDVGEFILEANGRRWAFDLGLESYDAGNYFVLSNAFTPWRWTYLRANNFGHNVLTFGTSNQNTQALATVTLPTQPVSTQNYAVANLSKVYASKASAVRRLLALDGSGKFVVKDVIEGATIGSQVQWQLIYCRGINTGKNICYGETFDNPMTIQAPDAKVAFIQEEEANRTNCPNPRYLKADLVSPATATFLTERIVVPDIFIPATPDVPEHYFEQSESEAHSACYRLFTSFPITSASMTVEIHLTPLRRP